MIQDNRTSIARSDAPAEPLLFDCPRHASLRLTPNACAGMWDKARSLPDRSLDRVMACRGCPIGAGHAGKPVRASKPALARAGRLCPRCGKSATKFVFGRICISCYNREAEFVKGANARGTKPRKTKLRPFYGKLIEQGIKVRAIHLARVASGLEVALTFLPRVDPTTFLVADARAHLLAECATRSYDGRRT